jgi:hypothetical protein
MNRLLTARPLAALVAVTALVTPSPAHALGSAFSFTAVTYQVVAAQLKIGSVSNGELT